jgi:hypothetical protein
MESKNLLAELKSNENFDFSTDDFQYCLYLGFIKGESWDYRPSNPIYASVISRYLNEDIKKFPPK